MEQSSKVSVIFAAFFFSVGAILTHFTGRFFPYWPICVSLAAISLTVGGMKNPSKIILAAIISLGFGSRIFMFMFPESMMRFDPDAFAVRSQVVIQTGHLSDVVLGFYSAAPLFEILGAQSAILAGLKINIGYVIFPLTVGIIFPLLSAVIASRTANNLKAGILAAAIVSVGASSTLFAIAPIPLILASVYLVISVFSVLLSHKIRTSAFISLFILLLLVSSLTHKIVILILSFFTIALFFYNKSVNQFVGNVENTHFLYAVFISLMFLSIQWLFLTDYFIDAALIIFSSAGIWVTNSAGSTLDPAAAVVINRPIIGKLRLLAFFFITVGIGGVAGIKLFSRATERYVQVIQAAAVATISFSLPSLVGAGPGFQRVYPYASVFVAVLISVAIAEFIESEYSGRQILASVVIVSILVSNPLSVTAVPDYKNTPREYLTAQEVSGKLFSNVYAAQEVQMDLFYGDEVINFPRAARGSKQDQYTVPNADRHSGLLSPELTEGTLTRKGYEYILLRTDVSVYRLQGGRFRLTWSPEQALDRQYNKIYSNDGATLYSHSE